MIKPITKRLFDIVVSALVLLLLLPFFAFFAILIKRDSPGPAFFWCRRMGRHGRPFRMLKFRTMYEQPSSYQGPPVTSEGDERITPIGQWLRDTKINELPQFWNVLIGEMSIVGPRPEDVDIALEWPEDARAEILSVRPGITSPASIIYHDEEHLLSRANVMVEYIQDILPDKMRLDRLYVRNQSFTADLDIIGWTVAIFVPQISRTDIPEGMLFFGLFSRFVHRYVNWFFTDLIISLLTVGVVGGIWRLQIPLNWGIDLLLAFAFGLALFFSGVNAITGLNRIMWSYATVEDGVHLLLTSSLVFAVILALNYLLGRMNLEDLPALPYSMLILIGLISQIGFVIARFRFRILTSLASRWLTFRQTSSGVGERVLIVGLGEEFNLAVWLLRREEYRYIFSIVGVVDDNDLTKIGMRMSGCQILGRTSDIPALIEKYDIGAIIFTTIEIAPEIREIINHLNQKGGLKIAFVNQMVDILSQQITRPVSMPRRFMWSQDQFKYFALYDTVTGLPNRILFQELLKHSLAYSRRYQTLMAVLFFKLEKLSTQSNGTGQQIWVDLLKQITDRLNKYKRESDTLAYLGNEEFGLILENISDEGIVYLLAKRIKALLGEPFKIRTDRVEFSIKISVCTNIGDFETLEEVRSEEIELKLNQRHPVFTSEGKN